NRRACVGTDVEVLVPLHDERNGVLHGLARYLLVVDLEYTGAAAGETAHVVEGQRADAEPVILEVELKRVLAGRELRSLPARALQINEVVEEHGFAPQHVEPVAAEPTALSDDHAFGTTLRDVDLRSEVE